MNWATVTLGECVDELRGGASIKGEEFTELGFPVLHKGTIREGAHLVFERDGKSHVPNEYAAAKPNAVVGSEYVVATFRNLVRTGETLGFMAPVPAGGEYLLAQGAYGLKLDESRLNKRFLSHLSNAWIFHKEVLKRMVGTTQVHIRNGEFLKIPIPLPPLAEQKRIAGILDAADALRAKRRESLAQLDTLLQSTFLDMFGDPVTNPIGWESVPEGGSSFGRIEDLANVAEVVDCKHRTPVYADEGYPVVRPRDVREKGISLDDCVKTTAEELADLTDKRVPSRGDIVYSRNATFGVASLVTTSERFAIGQDVCLIVPRAVNSVFLHYLLNSHFVRRQLGLATSGSTFKRINLRAIRKLKILVPPASLQEKFESVCAKQRSLRDQMRCGESELNTLFASLQSRAFRGDL